MTTVPDLIVTTTTVPKTTLPPPKADPPPFAPIPPPPPNVLKVQEAYTRDVGKGVARIDYATMDALGVEPGYVIKIQSVDVERGGAPFTDKRLTVAKVLPLYPSDEGKKVIRFDAITRANAQVVIGDLVCITKVSAPPLLSVKVRSESQTIPVVRREVFEGLALTVGDYIKAPDFDGIVVELNPGPVGVVTPRTELEIVRPDKGRKMVMICFEQEEAKVNARILEGWQVSEWLVASSRTLVGVMVPTAVMERVVIVEPKEAVE